MVHFIGLALLLGIAGLLDLRLIGFFAEMPIVALRGLMPFALGGFVLNLISGCVFLMGHPEQYAHNLSWWLKVGSLVVAGLNAAVFETTYAAKATTLRPGEPTPVALRAFGAVSLGAWLSALYWGRMLPFVGDAF